jgi:3-isopropylmalate dehydratase small subunit
VDCFKSLGVSLIIAESFGAIYERNAINAGMPIMTAACSGVGLENGDEVAVNFVSGHISVLKNKETVQGQPFPKIQMDIYQRGGLLVR